MPAPPPLQLLLATRRSSPSPSSAQALSLYFFFSPFFEVVSQTAQSFLPSYAAPPASGAEPAEWRDKSDQLARRLLRYALGIAAVAAVLAAAIAAVGTGLITNDAAVRLAVRPLALPLGISVLMAGFIGASEGVLLARRSIPFLASVYLTTVVMLPPALLSVKTRGGPVVLVWACFAAFQTFRATLFTARIWGPRFGGRWSPEDRAA